MLPNDQRGGSCFDCLSLLGPDARPCPECGSEIPSTQRAIVCARCGWSPIPDSKRSSAGAIEGSPSPTLVPSAPRRQIRRETPRREVRQNQ